MSSTLRLFANDNRVSTAVPTKSGILQVYPVKTTFADEAAWRTHWENDMKSKITVLSGDDGYLARWGYGSEAAPHLARWGCGSDAAPAPAPAPKVVAPAPAPAHAPAPKKTSLFQWNVRLKNNFTHTLPAGKYYIGDLCYVLGHDVYDNIFGGTEYSSGIYEEKNTGRTFLVSGTAYGDGLFMGSDFKEYAVDAGIIGICSASLMAKNDGGGHVYTFDEEITCRFMNGRFFFNWNSDSLVIDTTGDDDGY
jgi:hypothetical protein